MEKGTKKTPFVILGNVEKMNIPDIYLAFLQFTLHIWAALGDKRQTMQVSLTESKDHTDLLQKQT